MPNLPFYGGAGNYYWYWAPRPEEQAQAQPPQQNQMGQQNVAGMYDPRIVDFLHQQLNNPIPLQVQVPVAPPVEEAVDEPDEGIMLNPFKVGCDPEFLFVNKASGRTIPAMEYFNHAGEIGYDHGGRVAELRPRASKGTFILLKKLQGLIKSPEIAKINAKLRAGALCNNDSLGGHVHFGFNAFDGFVGENHAAHGADDIELSAQGQKVTRALDYLTRTLERLDILPQQECAQRRVHGQGYGKFGDVRNCRGHMEYRSMASWLFDPRVAFLCLTAAKLAASDPDGTVAALRGCHSFPKFKTWLELYENKDINAKRLSEKLLVQDLKHLQVDPDVDFRDRWQELGI